MATHDCNCLECHAIERERIINALYSKRRQLEQLVILSDDVGETSGKWFYHDRIKELDGYIALIKGEK